MDIPQSEDDAQRHIAAIRAAKRLDDDESDFSDLENALVILAEQLYQKSTHFLLELIQNADDNNYKVSTPTLNIILSERTLRIDCNEIGFSRRNAEAICKIGKSTKVGLDKSTRYIGEKGIGFKSVFKIANVVWIQSGYYSFKFDKYAKLGMIAPIWTPFPYQPKAGYTSMYLQLAEDCDTSELINDVKSLDPRLLIFLRKLQEINITVQEMPFPIWKTTLRCQGVGATEGEELVSLLQDGDSQSYRIIRRPISGLPPEPKRPDCHESEILLAFPLVEFSELLPASQNVYAFLPIRDYGFKFLIQADFLLIASREDINSSSQWNQELLRNIPNAFSKAVTDFNSGDLRYTWIKFLQQRSPLPDFFSSLEAAIFQALADSPIIESQSGELMAPWKLRMVPVTMLGEDEQPFILTERARSKYISPRYPHEKYRAELLWLGVTDVTPEEFIEDLDIFIESSPEEFQSMSPIWHSRLCKLLRQIAEDQPTLVEKVAELKVIPLRGGRWVSRQEVMYISEMPISGSNNIRIPNGVSMTEIDCKAASDRLRRNFFVFLGARMWTTEIVCKEIISTHASSSFVPERLPREDLVSHLTFLFDAGWTFFARWTPVPGHSACLWLSTETGSVRVSNETYIDSDKAGSASSCFGRNRERFSFIHGDYMKVPFERQHQLRDWMVANLGVAELPRLVRHIASTVCLSEDFRFLLQSSDYVSVLLLLRDCWDHYAKWIVQDHNSALEICRQQVREAIGSISVSCKGGGSARLRDTMLPTHNMEATSLASLSFIQIPDPENYRWRQLSHFGVIVTTGIGPFIKYLEILKESESTLENASELYRQIYIQCNLDRSLIAKCKETFQSKALIFTPRSEDWTGHEWLNLRSCVWEGPPCLKKTACLSKFYPEHHPFFCSMLRLIKADWPTLVDEARKIEACDPLDYISEVFVSISEHFQASEKSKDTEARTKMAMTMMGLTKLSIFPVDEGRSEGTFDYLSTSGTSATWFIADRPHLKLAFQGHIPLLALGEESIGKIGSLVTALNWNPRLLSRHARGVPDVGGDAQLNYRYTISICSRARFIARLVPPKLENRGAIIEQLCNAKVYTVEKITLQWVVKILNGEDVIGRADSGRVKITPTGTVLDVFLRKSDSDISHPPLELLEELTTFCQLTDASHVALLHWVMTETNTSEMEAIFERRGLQTDAPEVKGLIDAQHPNAEFWVKSTNKSQRDAVYSQDREAGLDSAVSLFMARFSAISQWDNTKARPWSKTDTDLVLSHLCRLENVDPYVLLPQKHPSLWNQRLRQAGAYLDDPTSVSFVHNSSDDGMKTHLRPTRLFPALVQINRARETIIEMLPDSTADVTTADVLAGEVYVSKLLKSELGDAYRPQIHWTSSFRRKAGLSPFAGNEIVSVGLQGSCILILDPDRFDLTVGGRQRLFS